MFPSACGGSVGTTGEASLQSFDAALSIDSSRPLRSCTSRLSRGEKQLASLPNQMLHQEVGHQAIHVSFLFEVRDTVSILGIDHHVERLVRILQGIG